MEIHARINSIIKSAEYKKEMIKQETNLKFNNYHQHQKVCNLWIKGNLRKQIKSFFFNIKN